MKFQIVSVIAALALIAPVLAMPHSDHYYPQQCYPGKYDCPKDYVCCPSRHHHDEYYCYKGYQCPHKDYKD